MNLSESKLVKAAADGDQAALGLLMSRYRDRLKKMIASRIDTRVSARIDDSDIIQEVHIEVSRRITDFFQNPDVPFYDWMRFLAKQKIAEIVRRHVHAQVRDVRREQSIGRLESGETSQVLTGMLMQNLDSPSEMVGKEELKGLVFEAIESLSESDREVLVLRHVKQLSTNEIAQQLEITVNTCRNRHLRALKRLKELLHKHAIDWEAK